MPKENFIILCWLGDWSVEEFEGTEEEAINRGKEILGHHSRPREVQVCKVIKRF